MKITEVNSIEILEIELEVENLKRYLDKDPEAAKAIALQYFEAFLALSKEIDTQEAINQNLLNRLFALQSKKEVELPPF